MRKPVIALLLTAAAAIACAGSRASAQSVTVEQLEQTLGRMHGMGDGQLAKSITDMKLTERLSDTRLARIEKRLLGRQSKEQLDALAGEAAFLDLPPADTPSEPAPHPARQAELLTRSVDYVNKTVAQWPSFTATRWTTRFEGTSTAIPTGLQDWLFSPNSPRSRPINRWVCPDEPRYGHRRLSAIDTSRLTLVNRHGHELVAFGVNGGEFACPERGVSTAVEFGDALAWVPLVVSRGRVAWSHWEQGDSTLLAVFRYSARVTFPPPSDREKDPPILVVVGGEFALNPADGSILRFTQTRRWREVSSGVSFPIEDDIMVEYAAATIGGTICFCPARRVARFLAPALWPKGAKVKRPDDGFYRKYHLSESPLLEYLNEVIFGHYQSYEPKASEPPGL